VILTFLKVYWKQAAIALTIAIIFAFGYYKGYSSQKREFDAFKLQIEANAKIQQQKNAEIAIKQQKINENITKEYEDAIKMLNSYYAANTKRLLNNSTGSRVSKNESATKSVDAKTEVNQINTSGADPLDCASDVLQLLYLQKWIEDQLLIQ